MKSIKFQELSFRKNPYWLILMGFTVIFLLLSLFDVWTFLDPQLVKIITIGCYIVIAVHSLQPFLYPNHVQWNKRGITIRVNAWLGMNTSFSMVREVIYAEDQYTIVTAIGQRKIINLEGIDPESKTKLLNILQSHVR